MTHSTNSTATFFVANGGHHTAMMQPVVRTLAAQGRRCRILSLCEFRGLSTPKEAFALDRVEISSVLPVRLRSGPGANRGAGRSGAAKQAVRDGLRRLAWAGLLRPRIQSGLGRDTAVAVLPNDAAYPYRDIAALLRGRGTPFVLLQEGIRFRLPGVDDEDSYGRGGAAAIAAWGESSASYFRSQGAPDSSIHLTGNPRFDGLDRAEWSRRGQELRRSLDLEGGRILLYLSNPIEHIGLARSTEAKLELFRAFCDAARPSIERGEYQVLVKLHGAETVADFSRTLDQFPRGAIRVVEGVPLYTLLAAADAAVVLASTAGMEALMFDLPLGVMAIPGVGYAFDFVQEGAAMGLGSAEEMADNLTRLMGGAGPSRESRDRYISRMVAVRSGATDRVADLVERCAR